MNNSLSTWYMIGAGEGIKAEYSRMLIHILLFMKINPYINSPPLPVEIVFHPSWWNKNAGITFDEDFFYHPLKRVEAEKRMEQNVFMDFYNEAEDTKKQFAKIAGLIERFVTGIAKETGTSSISVNRNVRNIKQPVFLHSECSHTMISTEQYEEFLLPIELEWSKKFRPFGIHPLLRK